MTLIPSNMLKCKNQLIHTGVNAVITYMFKNAHFQELQLLHYGTEACTPGHHFGPAMRDYYKIHYVLNGKGTFEVAGKTYPLQKGQGFLIVPHSVVHYKADQDDPWSIAGLHFKAHTALLYNKPAYRNNTPYLISGTRTTRCAPVFTGSFIPARLTKAGRLV